MEYFSYVLLILVFQQVLFLFLHLKCLQLVNAINMKSSLTTIKRVRQLHKSQETPLEHFMTLQKLSYDFC